MTGREKVEPAGAGGADGIHRALIACALEEDIGDGDWTTLWTVPEQSRGEALIVAKEDLTLAGSDLLVEVFQIVDPAVRVTLLAKDGAALEAGEVAAELDGPVRSLLTGERTALNFLGRLSGIATLTRRYVEAVAGTGARIVDTRKTTPGWRLLEKDAVRAGGGANHRMGLHDMILIKDNHIMAAGGVREALMRVSEANVPGSKGGGGGRSEGAGSAPGRRLLVEVEVSDLDELEEALTESPDRILLDNMTLESLREAVVRTRARAGRDSSPELEASGNMTLERVRAVAECGVDLISVGALTHSAASADFSMRMKPSR